jgi:BolA family transcriptional regulator, general stress-responsive regulator
MKKRIEEKLRENLKPKFLEVKNNSHLHSGHLGDDGSGETHFAIIVESDELENITKVQAHRKVNGLLKDEFLNGMHALEIEIRSKK